MEEISRKDFEAAKDMVPTMKETAKIQELTQEKFEEMMTELQNPVKFQKEMAIKIKVFLDHQIEKEMREKSVLSEGTRRWIDIYYKALDKIQSAIHGDKSVNIHLHKVSHSDVSTKIREAVIEIAPVPEKKKKTRKSED
jgi:hypothetical protein